MHWSQLQKESWWLYNFFGKLLLNHLILGLFCALSQLDIYLTRTHSYYHDHFMRIPKKEKLCVSTIISNREWLHTIFDVSVVQKKTFNTSSVQVQNKELQDDWGSIVDGRAAKWAGGEWSRAGDTGAEVSTWHENSCHRAVQTYAAHQHLLCLLQSFLQPSLFPF